MQALYERPHLAVTSAPPSPSYERPSGTRRKDDALVTTMANATMDWLLQAALAPMPTTS
ncbi:hypothetical protein I553_4927 [Mycobacterium xenopi 4042]|uniref:Uncharacterized protein n=1 Tax=Mycobacterium xenopi 4042 TaxID=1299334 RepID=X8AIH9_MYCXE|nr:hypothetical protein I553_4927 [Mycobacterium xenopi 4042]